MTAQPQAFIGGQPGPETLPYARRSQYLIQALQQMQQSAENIRSPAELGTRLLAQAVAQWGQQRNDRQLAKAQYRDAQNDPTLAGLRRAFPEAFASDTPSIGQTGGAAHETAIPALTSALLSRDAPASENVGTVGVGGIAPDTAAPQMAGAVSPQALAAALSTSNGGAPPPPPPPGAAVDNRARKTRDAMVRLMIGEDRDARGQQAAANVALNRSAQGMDLADVITQPGQFEPYGNEQTWARLNQIPTTDPRYQQAEEALNAAYAQDITGGAMNFYGPESQRALGRQAPGFAQQGNGERIGGNVYYRQPWAPPRGYQMPQAGPQQQGAPPPGATAAGAPQPPAATSPRQDVPGPQEPWPPQTSPQAPAAMPPPQPAPQGALGPPQPMAAPTPPQAPQAAPGPGMAPSGQMWADAQPQAPGPAPAPQGQAPQGYAQPQGRSAVTVQQVQQAAALLQDPRTNAEGRAYAQHILNLYNAPAQYETRITDQGQVIQVPRTPGAGAPVVSSVPGFRPPLPGGMQYGANGQAEPIPGTMNRTVTAEQLGIPAPPGTTYSVSPQGVPTRVAGPSEGNQVSSAPGQPYREAPVSGGARDPTSPANAMTNEGGLRREYEQHLNRYQVVRQAYQRIQLASQEAARAVAANQSQGPADIALITSYMKLLDPETGVREGEFANAQNSASVPENIRAMYNGLLQGGRLTPEQRASFVSSARAQYAPYEDNYRTQSQRFAGIAGRAGLDPRNIIVDLPSLLPPPARPQSQGPPSSPRPQAPQGRPQAAPAPRVRTWDPSANNGRGGFR